MINWRVLQIEVCGHIVSILLPAHPFSTLVFNIVVLYKLQRNLIYRSNEMECNKYEHKWVKLNRVTNMLKKIE